MARNDTFWNDLFLPSVHRIEFQSQFPLIYPFLIGDRKGAGVNSFMMRDIFSDVNELGYLAILVFDRVCGDLDYFLMAQFIKMSVFLDGCFTGADHL